MSPSRTSSASVLRAPRRDDSRSGSSRSRPCAQRKPAKIWRRCGQVPVAEGVAGHARAGGPRAAAQHPVVGAEEDLRVLAVGEGAGSPGSRRTSLAVHSQQSPSSPQTPSGVAPSRVPPATGPNASWSRLARSADGRLVAPRDSGAPSGPSRRLLPLGLGRQPRAAPSARRRRPRTRTRASPAAPGRAARPGRSGARAPSAVQYSGRSTLSSHAPVPALVASTARARS